MATILVAIIIGNNCRLLTADCLLLTAFCLLPSAYCPGSSLLFAGFWLALDHADLHDAAIKIHQKSFDIEVRMSSLNGCGEPVQLPFVDNSFFLALLFGGILRKVSSQQKFVRAAIAMVDDNHLMDVVKVDRGGKMLPESPAPIPIRPVINAQRRACQNHIIVILLQVKLVLHILRDVADQA